MTTVRILAVTPYYAPEGGGLERYAHEILSRLAARGHDVHAAAFTLHEGGDDARDGVKTRLFRPSLKAGNAPLRASFAWGVGRLIRETSPEVVVAHTPVPFPAEMASLAAGRARIPFVATYHAGRLRGSSFLLEAAARLDGWTLQRSMLARCARIVAVSGYVRDHALRRYRDRVHVIPPGVDSRRFRPSGEPAGPHIVCVAPLATTHRWKGVDVLWEAFSIVRLRRPQATLTLIGAGDRYEEFLERARAYPGAVRLPGRVSEDDLRAYYQGAGVVVLPSTSDAESFGMVLAEANACGRPVVASRIGGIPDFVREGVNGLLARPGDPVDLARRILEVLSDDDLARRLSVRGRELVVRDHDWARLASATEAVLEAAAANPRSANVGAELPRPATSL